MIRGVALVEPSGRTECLNDLRHDASFYAIWRENKVTILMYYKNEKEAIKFDETDFDTFLMEYEIIREIWRTI